MKFAPTKFSAKIQGHDPIVFAILTQREMEKFSKAEAEAKEANDPKAMLHVHREIVAQALTKAGDPTTVTDLEDADMPLFNALFNQIVEAHGIKLEAKMSEVEAQASGETKASVIS